MGKVNSFKVKLFIWLNILEKKYLLGKNLLIKEEHAQIFYYYEIKQKNILII